MKLAQHAVNVDDETKPVIHIGAAAFYDDYAGPGTFRHLDLLYRADCKGKPDYIRLKFEDESDMNKFFDWLAYAFDTPVGVDLFKHTEEMDTEVFQP